MSRWVEKFENHQIHESIKQVKDQIEGCKEIEELDSNDRLDDIFRIERVIKILTNQLDLIDPEIVNPNMLDQINKQLNNLYSSLNSYSNNPGNFAQLNNANSHTDNIVHRLNLLNTFTDDKDVENLTDSIISFRRSVGQHVRNLKSEIDEIEGKVPNVNKKLQELEEEIQNHKKRTDNIIGNFQEQFSDAQDKRQTEYATNKEEREKEFEELISKFDTQIDSEITDKRGKANEVLSDIQQHKDKAAEIVQIISNSSMGGGFEEVATNEKKARNWFRGGAIAALILLIVFAWNVFVEYSESTMSYTAIGIRAFVAFVIGILIAYLAKQAEKHERHYRKNKLTALQMATLDPYLSELDPDKQKKIKEELKEIFFYRKKEEVSELKQGEFQTKGNLQDFLNFVRNIVPKN